MSSIRSVEPIYLQPKPSRQLAGVLILLHVTIAAVFPYVDLPGWSKVFFGLLLAWSLYRNLRLHVLLNSPHSMLRLVWEVSGSWRVWDGLGREYHATLGTDCYVHSRVIVLSLHLLDGGGRRVAFFLKDSLDESTLRRLSSRLRTERARRRNMYDE